MQTITVPTKACWHCGQTGSVEVPVSAWFELENWLTNRSAPGGRYIQDILPDMPKGQREMLITGVHPHCWLEMFGDEEDDDEGDL